MQLTGLHFLLTYQCTFECDHCFVWGSPWQSGVFTLDGIERALDQAEELGTIQSIYFEGGEPFLYYPVLVEAVQSAARRGFTVGIVTNGYWATTVEDAHTWLRPLAEWISDLTVSSDLFHYGERISQQAKNATMAAEELGIGAGLITIERESLDEVENPVGQLPEGDSSVMYRGRAAERLAPQATKQDWRSFRECPYEDLVEPGRLHLDPFGNLQICQGIIIGNLFQKSLRSILDDYHPQQHPIAGPLLTGGPAALVSRYKLHHNDQYADACHLCYSVRRELRAKFSDLLGPDQVYGVFDQQSS